MLGGSTANGSRCSSRRPSAAASPRLASIAIEQVRQEVVGSRRDIAANVGGKVSNHFAYPFGSYNAGVIAELQAAGFKTAMTTKPGLNTRATPLYELRRWGGDGRDLATFLAESGLGALPPPPPRAGWILDDADPAALPRGGEWVTLGTYSFAPGQAASVTLGGPAGTLSADAVWFEPIATPDSPRDLVIDVPSGTQTQTAAGRVWIGPEWSSLTKSGTGSLVLDRRNAITGPLTVAGGSLQLSTADAVAAVTRIAVGADTVLDVAGLAGGYHVPAGQTIAGSGRVEGSIVFGRGSTISPGLSAASISAASIATPVVVPEPSATSILTVGLTASVVWGHNRRRTARHQA